MMNKLNYHNVHVWIYRHYGSAKKCSINDEHSGRFEWANIDGIYEKNIKHFLQLCRNCHISLDVHKKTLDDIRKTDEYRKNLVKTVLFTEAQTPLPHRVLGEI